MLTSEGNFNFLRYKDAKHFLEETGLTVEQGLQIVEAELRRLKGG